MTNHNQRSRCLSRVDVAASAATRAAMAVNDMVAESETRKITPLATTEPSWPGSTTMQAEPVAYLESARELEQAAHGRIERYIRLAREAGRSWFEIGDALDLHWEAVVSEESIADEAYDYALRYQTSPGRRTFWWTCPACRERIIDNGPWGRPPEQEDGHAANCARRTAQLEAWQQRASNEG